MRIILAKTAGFCMGVKRAMEKVLSLAHDKEGPIYTYGPLIHNRQAVEMLEERGICARTEFPDSAKGTVLLRTHGVPPDIVRQLRAAGLEVEDGTCPHVLRGQRSIARRSAEGFDVIIVGDRDHDEVVGLAGHAAGPCHILASVDEARTVPLGEKVLVVAQTTFNEMLFHEIVHELRGRKPDIEVVESVCTATSERQDEARDLAGRVDAMVVVGSRTSANTMRLAEIAAATGTPTFHVETADELDVGKLAQYGTIGVTAGASTPSWITSTVIDKLRSVSETVSLAARMKGMLARVVLDGNIYVGAGAAALTYAAMKMMGLDLAQPDRARLMAAAFAYIFCAYSFGRMAERRAAGAGMTRRGAFYEAHPRWMTAVSLLLAAGSIGAVWQFGRVAVLLLTLSYLMSVAYGLLISPRQLRRRAFFQNIPASKDLLSAAGWTVVTVLVPVVAVRAVAGVAGPGLSGYAVAAAVAFVFVLAFIRSVMFDFSDVMADRLLGRDTLPALIGVVPARMVLAVLAVVLAGVIAGGSGAGVVHGPGWWMLLCPAYVLCYLLVFNRPITVSERRCAVVVDGGMLLAGALAVAVAAVR